MCFETTYSNKILQIGVMTVENCVTYLWLITNSIPEGLKEKNNIHNIIGYGALTIDPF